MNGAALLKNLNCLGVEITLQGGRLHCRSPRGVMTTKFVQQLNKFEHEVVAILSGHQQSSNDNDYERNIPREWIEGLQLLEAMPLPADFKEDQWGTKLADADKFLDQWGSQVATLGWSTLEVFGVHDTKPEARLDMKGLVPSIAGEKIVLVSEGSATVETPTGARLRIFRKTNKEAPGRIPLWTYKVK